MNHVQLKIDNRLITSIKMEGKIDAQRIFFHLYFLSFREHLTTDVFIAQSDVNR